MYANSKPRRSFPGASGPPVIALGVRRARVPVAEGNLCRNEVTTAMGFSRRALLPRLGGLLTKPRRTDEGSGCPQRDEKGGVWREGTRETPPGLPRARQCKRPRRCDAPVGFQGPRVNFSGGSRTVSEPGFNNRAASARYHGRVPQARRRSSTARPVHFPFQRNRHHESLQRKVCERGLQQAALSAAKVQKVCAIMNFVLVPGFWFCFLSCASFFVLASGFFF